MNFFQFVNLVQEKVQQALGEHLNVEIMTTVKNNGTSRTGLSISDPSINISPTIYLEEFFDSYQSFLTIDEIVSDIVDMYYEVRFEQDLEIDEIQNFSYAKHKIAYKLINTAQNEKMLLNVPHLNYYDFSIIFFMFFDISPDNRGTILVTDKLLSLWKTNLHELYDIAQKNMPKLLPMSFLPMQDMICEMLHSKQIDCLEDNPLYVLTNKQRTFGASVLLYDNVLPKIGDHIQDSFFIIPSSIHELIIVPEKRSPRREELNKMIREVNATQISPEELLGECVYYYDWVNDCLTY